MYFDRDGVKLYYEHHGREGKPLLLLHGWGGSVESFLPLMRDFESARRVYAVDFPGHGNSPEPPEPWSVSEYARLIFDFMSRAGILGADIVAHSFGGRVTLLLAAEHPEAVGKLLLTGCAGLRNRPSGTLNARARAYRTLRGLADNGLTRKLFSNQVDAWREALVQRFGSADYKALTPSMRQTFNRVINQDLADCLPRIQSETLLIWGTEDTATPLWMGEQMEREIPGAALIRFEGLGHFAYLDDYPRFKTIAWKFLVG